MAEDLSILIQQLKSVESESKKASDTVNQLSGALKELLRSSATGGTPTDAGIDAAISRLSSGLKSSGAGTRVGGGAYTSRAKEFSLQIDELITKLITAKFDLYYRELQKNLATSAINTATFRQEKSIFTPQNVSKNEELLNKYNQTMAMTPESVAREKFAAKVNQLIQDDLALIEEQKQFDTRLNQLKQQEVSIQEQRKAELQQNLVELKRVQDLGPLKVSQDSPDEILNSINTKMSTPLVNLQGAGFSVKDGVQTKETLSQLNNALENYKAKIGMTADSQLKLTTRMAEAEGGFIRYATSVHGAGSYYPQLIQYVDQFGTVLTEQQMKMQLAAQAQAKLVSSLKQEIGPQRYGELEKMMRKQGFDEKNVTKTFTQQPSGVTSVYLQKMGDSGVMHKSELTIDKFGGVLNKTNRRLLDFTHSVIKNTAELFKWSIGVGLVYGAYYKLGQIIDLAISNQTKLVDVAITLGNAQRDVNDIFTDAATVAKATGENINDVLETYTMAYRAVGAVEDPLARTTAANQLLTDATILNKLSTLDAAESIDVLAGSLRQIAKPGETAAESFRQGTLLLDKWVAVSKKANIDIGSLATAFSVTAESAENSGLSIDELNGVITALSEKIGGLGGKETGNAVRALIGGVYQQQAAKTLNAYGIAVTDTEGKMRSFLSISKDIYNLYERGLIEKDELNQIGYVLGGGVRRGQQYVAFLSDMARINEISAVSSQANGDAQLALAKKMQTVETSSTKLSNAVQTLAQSMGDRGGLLEATANLNIGLAGTVEFLAKFVDIAGPATTAIIALGAGFAYSKIGKLGAINRLNYPGQKIQGWFENKAVRYGGGENAGGYYGDGFGLGTADPRARALRGVGGFIGKNSLALGLGAIAPLQSAAAGRWDEAGAEIAGAAIGFMISGGSPVGTVIGSAAGGALLDFIKSNQFSFADAMKPVWGEPPKTTETEPDTQAEREKAFTDALNDAYSKTIGGVNKREGYRGPAQAEAAQSMLDSMPSAIRSWSAGSNWAAGVIKEVVNPVASFIGSEVANIRNIGKKDKGFEGYTGETFALERVKLAFGENSEQYRNLMDLFKKAQGGADYPQLSEKETQYYTLSKDIGNAFEDTFANLMTERREDIRDQLRGGGITRSESANAQQEIRGLDATLTELYQTLYGDQQGNILVTDENIKKIEELSETYIMANSEDKAIVNQLTSEYRDLSAQYESAMKAGSEDADMLGTKMKGVKEDLVDTLQAIKAASAAQIAMPSFIKTDDLDINKIKEIEKLAREMEKRKLDFLVENDIMDQATADQKVADAKPIFIDMGKEFGFYIAQGIMDSSSISDAIAASAEEGMSNLNYDFMKDVTEAELMSIMPQYDAIRKAIVDAGGKSEEEGKLLLLEDTNDPKYMKKDWKIVQYLLQQILKTEEKQLDGMYNLPSGASFYVPFQAWAMDRETREASATGEVDLDSSSFDASSENIYRSIENFSQYVDMFGRYVMGIDFGNNADNKEFRLKAGEIRFSEKHPDSTDYDTVYGQPKYTGPRGATDFNPYVDEYGRPLVGPGGGTSGPMASGQAGMEPSPNSGVTGGLDFTKDITLNAIIDLINALRTLLSPGASQDSMTDPQTYSIPQTNELPTVTTALSLNLQSQTQLIVDGRTLADIIKPYLYEDMIAYEGGAGSATSNYVMT